MLQHLYDDVLNAGRIWGVRTLEEDWFGQMWDGLHCLRSNITLASTWMLYLYQGAARNGMTLQQCTTYPRHVMMGLQMPAATQQRVSNDYRPGEDHWQIGITSLWVNALGQRPFKDCFWSTDSKQYCSDYYRGEYCSDYYRGEYCSDYYRSEYCSDYYRGEYCSNYYRGEYCTLK
jgi:hypothetical protein